MNFPQKFPPVPSGKLYCRGSWHACPSYHRGMGTETCGRERIGVTYHWQQFEQEGIVPLSWAWAMLVLLCR